MKPRLQAARPQDPLRAAAILPTAAAREPATKPSGRFDIKPIVIDEQTIERVRELRAQGLSPKEIARSLCIKQ